MFAYALVVVLAFIAATSTVSAATGVSGFAILSASYASTDTTCTGIPSSLIYLQLNLCSMTSSTLYYMYTADSTGTISQTSYSDSACTKSLNVYTPTTKKCVSGSSSYVFSATAPDATLNVQQTGLVAYVIQYTGADTMCASAPQQIAYFPVASCILLTAASNGYQYIADGSGNVYQKQFSNPTCTADGSSVAILPYQSQSTKCVNGVSRYQYLPSLPSAWGPATLVIRYTSKRSFMFISICSVHELVRCTQFVLDVDMHRYPLTGPRILRCGCSVHPVVMHGLYDQQRYLQCLHMPVCQRHDHDHDHDGRPDGGPGIRPVARPDRLRRVRVQRAVHHQRRLHHGVLGGHVPGHLRRQRRHHGHRHRRVRRAKRGGRDSCHGPDDSFSNGVHGGAF